MFGRLIKVFRDRYTAKIIGAVTRRGLDLIAGYLAALALKYDFLKPINDFTQLNLDSLDAALAAAAIGLASLLWSVLEKKDNKGK